MGALNANPSSSNYSLNAIADTTNTSAALLLLLLLSITPFSFRVSVLEDCSTV